MNAPTQRHGVHILGDMDPPGKWPLARWQVFAADAQVFRMRHGAKAIELGWTAIELFGMSRSHPWTLQSWGAVPFVNGCKIAEITAGEIWIETGRDRRDPLTGRVTPQLLQIRKRKPAADAVLAWNL